MAKKCVNLKNYANKGIDTKEFIELNRVEATTQTYGLEIHFD
jgi:hypothetical protein